MPFVGGKKAVTAPWGSLENIEKTKEIRGEAVAATPLAGGRVAFSDVGLDWARLG